MRIYSRSGYDAPPLGEDMARQAFPLQAFLHHSDDENADQYNTKAEQVRKVKDIDNFHRNTRKWSMGGYHYLVFQRIGSRYEGSAFQLRPATFVPAAQLNHNYRTLAICVVGNGEHEVLQADTVRTIAKIIRMYGGVKTLGGHRDVTPTDCPGDRFYKSIPRIADLAGVSVYRG